MAERTAKITRTTGETDITISLSLDGNQDIQVNTGIGFMDHMLHLLAKHGRFGLVVDAKGDTYVDGHHTVEDIGLTLGQALKEALGDKAGIERYGDAWVPMDEALAQVVIDLSGRPYLVFDAELPTPVLGTFETELVEEFFRALAFSGLMNLHARVLYGKNTHHMIEGLFKATGRALRKAVTINPDIHGVNSTKGVI
ncbi:MAG: imidazoleglycerol-phosphate dehydratase HisB [Veillonella sp.]|nr:imidazoleglycerol-phosphate dehydratase HisB [Veillonella sp.]MCF0155572.1 imidazoleglycerol-phosphate dehydratase HisB [Veillonella sp.]